MTTTCRWGDACHGVNCELYHLSIGLWLKQAEKTHYHRCKSQLYSATNSSTDHANMQSDGRWLRCKRHLKMSIYLLTDGMLNGLYNSISQT